ncbi:uncharacterized protein LOC123681019 [Harmonia axyridis]|uniref:uncharacterized protein LOC123681019 n=1 Tax=Harmonia axyridis TaxID=115357 RepID=UPI001E278B8A|nr:uncharacterized protein LOC123681019 [Harmonia axyridis]
MKLLVLFLATAAVASASLFSGKRVDFKEDGTIMIQGMSGKQVVIKKPLYGLRNLQIDATGPNTLVIKDLNNNQVDTERNVEYNSKNYDDFLEERNKPEYYNVDIPAFHRESAMNNPLTENNNYPEVSYPGKYSSGLNVLKDQNVDQYFYNLFFKMFDREMVKNILNQQQMYDQKYNRLEFIATTWDFVFTQGVFDQQYLIKIINNNMLRTLLVQLGFFDKEVLAQIMYTYENQGVYDQYLLQKLVNTQVLKYFFIEHGVSVYDILGQTSYKQYYGNNEGTYGLNNRYNGYNILERIVSEPVWRNVMIQYGIFNKNILDQILYQYNTQGVYNQVLLKQLVNKQALYNILIQYGVVDQVLLRQFIINENLGLNFLFENNFFKQTQQMTFNQLSGVYGNNPEYTGMQMLKRKYRSFLNEDPDYEYNPGLGRSNTFTFRYPLIMV